MNRPVNHLKVLVKTTLILSFSLAGLVGKISAQAPTDFLENFTCQCRNNWKSTGASASFSFGTEVGSDSYLRMQPTVTQYPTTVGIKRDLENPYPYMVSYMVRLENPLPPSGVNAANIVDVLLSNYDMDDPSNYTPGSHFEGPLVRDDGGFFWTGDPYTNSDGSDYLKGPGYRKQLEPGVWYQVVVQIKYPGNLYGKFHVTVLKRIPPAVPTEVVYETDLVNLKLDKLQELRLSLYTSKPTTPLIVDLDNIAINYGYTLTVSAEHGSIEVVTPPNAHGYYEPGAIIQATPHPDPGYEFDSWEGEGSRNADNPLVFPLNGNVGISAIFKKVVSNHTLTVLNLNGQPTPALYQIPEGGSIDLSTFVPFRKAFIGWQQKNGPGVLSIGSPDNPATTVSLSGGDATLQAVFEGASVKVDVKDADWSDAAKLSPVIKVTNTAKVRTLTDFQLRFYFHTMCLKTPHVDFPGGTSWSEALEDLGYGNFKLTLSYEPSAGPLLPNQTVTTPSGLQLYFDKDCPTCRTIKWSRKHEDVYSLGGAEGSFKKLNPKTSPLVVAQYPADDDGIAIFGQTPGMHKEFAPGQPPGIGTYFRAEVPPATVNETQLPNVTFAQVFQNGNLVFNGSFEQGKRGWKEFSGDPDNKVFDIMDHGPTPDDQAFDGYHYARITPHGESFEGIYFDIPETDPAFETLLNHNFTFSAWVRGNAPYQLVYFHGTGGAEGGIAYETSPNWQYIQLSLQALDPLTTPEGRVFRFGIFQASVTTEPIYVDGVSLTTDPFGYSPPKSTYKLYNTRNSMIQSKTILPEFKQGIGLFPEKSHLVISSMEYDAMGRASKAYLPISKPCNISSCNTFFTLPDYQADLAASSDQYGTAASLNTEGLPDAGGYPYSMTMYEQDQLTSIAKVGSPGSSYQAEDASKTADHQDHTVQTHYSGVSSAIGSEIGADLSKPANKQDPVYAYKHTVDKEHSEHVEWKNGFGQVLKSADVIMENGQRRFSITESQYNAKGNLVKILPPLSCEKSDGSRSNIPNCVEPSTYDYDEENRLKEEKTPDGGAIHLYYDLAGNVRGSQNPVLEAANSAIINLYDDFDRLIAVGEFTGGNPSSPGSIVVNDAFLKAKSKDPNWPMNSADASKYRITQKYFYDKMPPPVPEELADFNTSPAKNVRLYPQSDASDFQYSRGKLCAVIKMHPPVNPMDVATLDKVEEVSTVAYQYDKFGRTIATYEYNGFISDPNYKLQMAIHSYDLSGRLTQTLNYDNAWVGDPSRNVFFSYNAIGQLERIDNDGGQVLASYEYFLANGKIKRITLDANGANPITVEYTYDITGGSKQIHAVRHTVSGPVTLLDEKLFYDLVPVNGVLHGKFNGNIAQIDYLMGSQANATRSQEFTYDGLNRLLDAVFYLKSGSTKTRSDKYSESIRYDDNGRIVSLRRSDNVNHATGGEYHYASLPNGTKPEIGTNRLAYVDANMSPSSLSTRNMSGSPASPNFTYDASGRMIGDRSRAEQIRYDFNDRPLEFSHSDGITLSKDVMRYNEAGNRISHLHFEGGTASIGDVLVDGDGARPSDAGNFLDGYQMLQDRAASAGTNPPPFVLNVVPDQAGFVEPPSGTEFSVLATASGNASLEIVGVPAGTPEYEAMLEARNSGFTLTRATHYTGLGNEIREESANTAGVLGIKVLTDIPGGLGRFEAGSPERLYSLKNHIGNTMVTALSSGTYYRDVFDYFPYGVQDKLTVGSADKVRDAFTGKELDDELGLYYFGARYYDPEVGVWISPDPVNQFANAYAYGSNPTNTVDPDGKAAAAVLAGWLGMELTPLGWATTAGIAVYDFVLLDLYAAQHGGLSYDGIGPNSFVQFQDGAVNQKPGEPKQGTSGGPRAGKGFTPKGKKQLDDENANKYGGKNKCEKCGKEVVPGQKSTKGVAPPPNEKQRDHIIPKSQGGDGDPSNGQVLCRGCNLEKSDKLP